MTDTITEKTGLPIGMVVSLVVSIAGGVSAFYSIKGDVAQTRADATRLEETVKDMRVQLRANEQTESERRNAHELRIQRNEDTQANVLKTLGRLEVQMERLVNGQLREASRRK